MLKKLSRRYLIILNVFLVGIIFLFSFYQNFRFTDIFSSDLRNRVVGVRLVKEGKIPYFYKWSQGENIRYFDPENVDQRVVSSVTATPVFHHLLSPICNLPQQTLSVIWFTLSYIALLAIIGLAISCCTSIFGKLVVLNVGTFFCLSDAFKIHLLYGQLYIFIALIIMAVYFLLLKNKRPTDLAAGLLMALVLFIRPLTAVFIFPFILFIKSNCRFFLAALSIVILLYAGFCLLNNNERDQWISYSKAVNEHSKVEVHPSQLNDKPENITHIEGYDLTRIKTDLKKKPIVLSFETFNIHLLYQKLTGKLIPALALSIGWIFCMAVLWFAYFKMFRKNYDLSRIFILGYMLYMVSEVFAPVSRNIYCAVQFFPIVLIYLSVCRSFYTRSALLIFSGLLLNITDLTFLPMRHSIGEVLIFCGFLIFVFKERDEQFFNA